MIKESIEGTIKLIEDIEQVDPNAIAGHKKELNELVVHMKGVVKQLLDKPLQQGR